ncbi:MAG TPA: hypothetical protein VFJ12_11620 [Segeticoccus sp.]|jgi:hypothetical protein|nr:hypothetical protein [Segeticoccus sp.]
MSETDEWNRDDDRDVQLRALDDDATRTESIGPLEDLDSEDAGEDLDDEDWREEPTEDDG